MKTKTILLAIVLLLITGSIYWLEKSRVEPPLNTISTVPELTSPQQLKDGKYSLAPELTGLSGYLNAEPGIHISDYRGKVVLIDFWTYTCINCIRTLPHLTDWDKKYREKGLVIIGVHTPEFEFEKKKENVEAAMKKYGIEYRVVQDNDYTTWRAFQNRYWPHKYLIDKDGYIRYDHIGEGKYDETERKIQELLAETGHDVEEMGVSAIEDTTPHLPTTQELYLGYTFALPRGQDVGNAEGLQPDTVVDYVISGEKQRDIVYLQGQWKSNPDNLQALEAGSSLYLDFTAKAVNIVADAPMPLKVKVFINDQPITKEQAGSDVQFKDGQSYILIDQPQLYNIVDGEYGQYTLKLTVMELGFAGNAFTFG